MDNTQNQFCEIKPEDIELTGTWEPEIRNPDLIEIHNYEDIERLWGEIVGDLHTSTGSDYVNLDRNTFYGRWGEPRELTWQEKEKLSRPLRRTD